MLPDFIVLDVICTPQQIQQKSQKGKGHLPASATCDEPKDATLQSRPCLAHHQSLGHETVSGLQAKPKLVGQDCGKVSDGSAPSATNHGVQGNKAGEYVLGSRRCRAREGGEEHAFRVNLTANNLRERSPPTRHQPQSCLPTGQDRAFCRPFVSPVWHVVSKGAELGCF